MTRLPELLHAILRTPWPDWWEENRLILADYLADADDPREEMVREKMPCYTLDSSGVESIHLIDHENVLEEVVCDSRRYRNWLLNLFPEIKLGFITIRDRAPILHLLHETPLTTSWRTFRIMRASSRYGTAIELTNQWVAAYATARPDMNVWPRLVEENTIEV